MSFWKKLPYDIQTEILLSFDIETILYFYENNIKLSEHFIELFKKSIQDREKLNLFLFSYIEIDRLINWIKRDNKSIIHFLYKDMEQVKYRSDIIFFSFLYSSEEFIEYVLKNMAYINLTIYNKRKNAYYYGIELIAIKLRNGYYTKSLGLLNEVSEIFFINNTSIKNKLLNYRSQSKINISYFYRIEKAYQKIQIKNNDSLFFNIENLNSQNEDENINNNNEDDE